VLTASLLEPGSGRADSRTEQQMTAQLCDNTVEAVAGTPPGATDLGVGARQAWVRTKLLTREGAAELVTSCTCPSTRLRCGSRVHSDFTVFSMERGRGVARDLSFDHLTDLVDVAVVGASTGPSS
jgi:acyl CoA:acetate/3-ketoacid CoA transferase beta subunit